MRGDDRHFYFAYGSNLDRDQMTVRCPGSRPLFRAQLRDYRLDFTHFSRTWRGGAADILADRGSTVWGVIYELDVPALTALDGFEGGYHRIHLDVHDDLDTAHTTISYTVSEKLRHPPTEEYLGKMLRWGEHWGFPTAYLSGLRRQVEAMPHPAPRRRPPQR